MLGKTAEGENISKSQKNYWVLLFGLLRNVFFLYNLGMKEGTLENLPFFPPFLPLNLFEMSPALRGTIFFPPQKSRKWSQRPDEKRVRSDGEAAAAWVTMSESLKQDSPKPGASLELWLLRGSV